MGVAYLLRETKEEWLNGNGHPDPATDDEDEIGASPDRSVFPRSTNGQSIERSRDGPR